MDLIDIDHLIGSINGTVVGGAALVSGKKGLALYTNGVDQYVEFVYQEETCLGYFLLCTRGWVIAFWVQPANSNHGVFIDTRDVNYGNYRKGVAIEFNNWVLNAHFITSSNHWIVSAVDFQGWVHVVVTWQQCYATNLYINGKLADTENLPYVAPEQTQGSQRLTVGADYRLKLKFSGKLDEVRVWDTVMSDDEVSALYTVDSGVKTRV